MDHTGKAVGAAVAGGRRSAPRAAARLEAAYEDVDRQVFLPTRDVSEGGVYLLASELPPVGIAAKVTLELPGEPALLRLWGSVVRRSEAEPRGFALRLDPTATPPAARASLRHFVETSLAG